MGANIQKLYINGRWESKFGQQLAESINPANKEVIGYYASADENQVHQAVESAYSAYSEWKRTPAPARAAYLYKAAEFCAGRKEELAKMMTKEMGKVLPEALGEVNVVIETCKYMAAEGRRLFGETVPSGLPNCDIQMVREPIGVIACITPWNFPIALASYKICAAIVSGNTVVWKPASETALSAGILMEIFQQAGFPAGVINLITGSGSQVGKQLAAHPHVASISFTGSTEVGRGLSIEAARQMKKISMELGGKNAAIVLKDADLTKAADCIVRAAFSTTGQKCTATSRVIVEKEVKQALLNLIVDKTRSLEIGDGMKSGVDIGPLVNERQLSIVHSYVEEALADGAKLECGGKPITDLDGYFYEPTVLSNVSPNQKVANEEIFGPVLAIVEAEDYEEAININNQTVYGLSTSLFTESLHYAKRGARDIESGLVYINNGTANAEIGVAFGGLKQSGNGSREVSHHVLDSMTEWKSIYVSY
ncbi:aldehyde dehydrogenase family protein [Pradoshia sp.]